MAMSTNKTPVLQSCMDDPSHEPTRNRSATHPIAEANPSTQVVGRAIGSAYDGPRVTGMRVSGEPSGQ